jgi:hypothetical protein
MKTIKITTLATLLIIVFVAAMCRKYDNAHEYITIINKSDKNIVFQLFHDNRDTLFYCSPRSQGITILTTIKADSLFSLGAPNNRGIWEYFFHNESMILSISIGESNYDYDQYIPCDTIRKYIPILHNYRLTLEDLNRMNWTVVYPPEE